MNTRYITAIALLLATFSATAAAAGAGAVQPYAFNVKHARTSQHQIQLGTTAWDVVQAIGLPNLRASHDVWMYYNHHAQETTLADAHGCTILVVTFTHARVSDIKLVNPSAAKLIAAGAKSGTAVAFVADRPPTLLADRR